MQISRSKPRIPWMMAGARVALGPLVAAGAECNWSGTALAAMVAAALVSDIYDGILARRWRCDTAALRLFDSMADTFFYLCTGVALWIARPDVFRSNAKLVAALLAAELLRFAFDFVKFGKPGSYHSWMAKSWGLVLATVVMLTFATRFGHSFLAVALLMGIACNLENLAMSLILREWTRDVLTLRMAWKLQQAGLGGSSGLRASQSGAAGLSMLP